MKLASDKMMTSRKDAVRHALLDILGGNDTATGGEVLGMLADIGAVRLTLESDDGDFLLRVLILETE